MSPEVAKVSEIGAGQTRAVVVDGKEVLVANLGGKFYAVARRCTHMGGDLAKAALEGTTLTCPRHAAQYDVTTGKCVRGPQLGPLKPKGKDLATYTVKVEGDSVKVEA